MSSSSSSYSRRLALGTGGVWVCYVLISYLTEKIFHERYPTIDGRKADKFAYPTLITWVGCLCCSLYGVQKARSPSQPINRIPTLERFILGLLFTLNYLPTNYALLYISYPLQVIAKNTRYLLVVVVGVFFSRVTKSRELKLPRSKFLIAVLITIAAVMFMYYESKKEVKKHELDPKKEWIGYVLVLVAIVCDALFSDSQAYCKANFKPSPNQLFLAANLYGFLLIFTWALLSGELQASIRFCLRHPLVLVDILMVGGLQVAGQVSVYYVISNFKQHIYPLISTSRKIITILLSIFAFNHTITKLQWVALVVLFGTMAYELWDEIRSQEQHKQARVQRAEQAQRRKEEQVKAQQQEARREMKQRISQLSAVKEEEDRASQASALIEKVPSRMGAPRLNRMMSNDGNNSRTGSTADRLESLSKYRYGWRVDEVIEGRETEPGPPS